MSWTLIEHQALTSSVASVTLGSGGTIPQTYKTLKLVVSGRTDRTTVADDVNIELNGSSANFTARKIQGSGSAATSASYTNNVAIGGVTNSAQSTSNTFSNAEYSFPNYAGSSNKPFSIDYVSESNETTVYSGLFADLWSNTAAITSIKLTPANSSWVSGSTFTLYGLA